MKKIDMFKADRAMADRVSEYMNKKVWGITLRKRLQSDILKHENSIQGLENCRGSIVGTNVDDAIAELRAQIADKKQKVQKQIAEEARFEWDANDKAFYKAYKNATTDAMVYTALEKWFEAYHLDVAQTDFEFAIIKAIGGERNATATQIIRSGATQFVVGKRTQNEVMRIFYGKLSEKMLEVGTLKPSAIPEDIREAYAPKKRAKKANK